MQRALCLTFVISLLLSLFLTFTFGTSTVNNNNNNNEKEDKLECWMCEQLLESNECHKECLQFKLNTETCATLCDNLKTSREVEKYPCIAQGHCPYRARFIDPEKILRVLH